MWVELRHAIVLVFSDASRAFSFFVDYYLHTVCSSMYTWIMLSIFTNKNFCFLFIRRFRHAWASYVCTILYLHVLEYSWKYSHIREQKMSCLIRVVITKCMSEVRPYRTGAGVQLYQCGQPVINLWLLRSSKDSGTKKMVQLIPFSYSRPVPGWPSLHKIIL